MIKSTQNNANNSLKRNIMLEHELETEKLNNSMINVQMETLNQKMNTTDASKANPQTIVLINDRNFLKNKLHKVHVCICIFKLMYKKHLCLFFVIPGSSLGWGERGQRIQRGPPCFKITFLLLIRKF